MKGIEQILQEVILWITKNLPKVVEIITELVDLIRDIIALFKPQPST